MSIPPVVLRNENNISDPTHTEIQNTLKVIFQYSQKENKYFNHRKENAEKFQNPERKGELQKKVFDWFSKLNIDRRVIVTAIKNKWLVDIIFQMNLSEYYLNSTYFSAKELYKGEEELADSESNYLASYASKDLNLYTTFFRTAEMHRLTEDEKPVKRGKELREFVRYSTIDSMNDTVTLCKEFLSDEKEFENLMLKMSDGMFLDNYIIPTYDERNNVYYIKPPQWFFNHSSFNFDTFLTMNIELVLLIYYEYYICTNKPPEMKLYTQLENVFSEMKKMKEIIEDREIKFRNDPEHCVDIQQCILSGIPVHNMCFTLLFDGMTYDMIEINTRTAENKNKVKVMEEIRDGVYNLNFQCKIYVAKGKLERKTYDALINKLGDDYKESLDKFLTQLRFFTVEQVNLYEDIFITEMYKFLNSKLVFKNLDELVNEINEVNEDKPKKKPKKKNKKNKKGKAEDKKEEEKEDDKKEKEEIETPKENKSLFGDLFTSNKKKTEEETEDEIPKHKRSDNYISNSSICKSDVIEIKGTPQTESNIIIMSTIHSEDKLNFNEGEINLEENNVLSDQMEIGENNLDFRSLKEGILNKDNYMKDKGIQADEDVPEDYIEDIKKEENKESIIINTENTKIENNFENNTKIEEEKEKEDDRQNYYENQQNQPPQR
ncbi:MAG: hypothetical protein MJ252_26605, partial [archaeon]|nr:hypothetical protein [archaeon]